MTVENAEREGIGGAVAPPRPGARSPAWRGPTRWRGVPDWRDWLPAALLTAGAVAGTVLFFAPLGPVTAQAPMDRMILALRMTPEASARLEQRLAELQDPDAPGYHQWLTPEQFGAEFGPSPAGLARVTEWLKAGGFTVDEVAAGRMAITFSGTVETVENAFRTPILKFEIDGKVRQANLEDPSIPLALADVVEGVVSLHDIFSIG